MELGIRCLDCAISATGMFFDRTGGPAIVISGSADVNVSGWIMGAGRANAPQYSGPAVLLEPNQWGRTPSLHSEGLHIQQWSPQASYYKVVSGWAGGLISVDGKGVQPTPYGIYADQATHQALAPYVLAPPAYPQ